MKFVFSDGIKNKFAWIPVCISKSETGSVWIWLEPYKQKVIKRYGIGGCLYYRESKDHSGEVTGIVG